MPDFWQRRGPATLIGAAGIVLWSTETALIKLAGDLPPFEITALAFAAAALLSLVVWGVSGASPLVAFRQPARVWLITVAALVGYHASLYYAVPRAPASPAALLQGCTPLVIVLGSLLLPGERVRWWHFAGLAAGIAGTILLIGAGGADAHSASDPAFYLSIVGAAAALWGVYSLVSRHLRDVPTSAMGAFFAVSALVAAGAHVSLESFVMPSARQWLAIAALGALPMGLALYFWDRGVKRGDLQALGQFSYLEPFFGAAAVVVLGQGDLHRSLVLGGLLTVGGAALAARGLFEGNGGGRDDQPVESGGAETPEPHRSGFDRSAYRELLAENRAELEQAVARAYGGGPAAEKLARAMSRIWAAIDVDLIRGAGAGTPRAAMFEAVLATLDAAINVAKADAELRQSVDRLARSIGQGEGQLARSYERRLHRSHDRPAERATDPSNRIAPLARLIRSGPNSAGSPRQSLPALSRLGVRLNRGGGRLA